MTDYDKLQLARKIMLSIVRAFESYPKPLNPREASFLYRLKDGLNKTN